MPVSVQRAIPGVRLGPAGRPHFAHPHRAPREPREQRLSVLYVSGQRGSSRARSFGLGLALGRRNKMPAIQENFPFRLRELGQWEKIYPPCRRSLQPVNGSEPEKLPRRDLVASERKNWSLKTERDCTAPCNRAPIRNCSRRWPRASMHGMHRYRPNSAEEVLTSANLTFRRPLNRIDSELRMNKEARMVA